MLRLRKFGYNHSALASLAIDAMIVAAAGGGFVMREGHVSDVRENLGSGCLEHEGFNTDRQFSGRARSIREWAAEA